MTSTVDREMIVLRELANYYETCVEPTLGTHRACVLATRITNLMLTEFEIPHVVTHIDSFIVNDDWWDFVNSKSDLDITRLPETAWSIGCNSAETPKKNGFPGHLVVETDNYFVDLSSRQFDRPQHNIITAAPLIVPLGQLTELPDDFWSVPIPKGHYLFRDAAVPRNPSRSCSDSKQNHLRYVSDCEAAIRHALHK